MTARIDVTAPATITVLSGGPALSSLDSLPPFGISLSDPMAADMVTLTVVAANSGTVLSALGANVVANGNTLTVTGISSQVSAMLANLLITEPVNTTADTLMLTAVDPAVLTAKTAIAVQILPAGNPAFTAPPAIATVTPNKVMALPGLVLGDPGAMALAAMGQGRSEALQINLSVAAGVLLLPGYSALSGIEVTGLGTGTLSLNFTADQLGAVNSLLAGLDYAGPGQTRLQYSVADIHGPLGAASSSGAMTLAAAGAAGPNGTYAIGNQTLILGTGSIAAGTVLDVTNIVSDPGGINGGAVWVGAGAALEVPGGAASPGGGVSLSGTSYDFGLLDAASFAVAGSAVIATGASFTGLLSLGTQSLVDFTGTLTAGSVSLAANAVLTGDGTLLAGTITGPGTLIAQSGDTLAVTANITGATRLDAAGGGVLVLGADSIAAGATLGFIAGTGVLPDTGGYADTLAQSGGVIVIDDPQLFGGTISGFVPGVRLVFPGLSGLTVLSVTPNSFEIAGTNSSNANVAYTIHAAIPLGTTLVAGMDAQGDAELSLRSNIETAVGGSAFGTGSIDASIGITQDILGLQLLLPGWTAQSLQLTLTVGGGELTLGASSPSATLLISAFTPAALNATLGKLAYTANAGTTQDMLTISSSSSFLTGLDAKVPITIKSAGTVAGFGVAPTAAQTASFAGALTLVTQAAAAGKILITGAADFADDLVVNGIAGAALVIDAGGTGVFDPASNVTLGGNVTVGDAAGPGTLGVETDDFQIGTAGSSSNLVVASSSLAAGSVVEITGGLTVAGALLLGVAAAARLDVTGELETGSTTIDAAGILVASGTAAVEFGGLLDAGNLALHNGAQAGATNLILTGSLALGGQSALTGLSSAVIGGAASLVVGQGAILSAGELNAIGGNISIAGLLEVTGNLLSGAVMTLSGGTVSAAVATLGSGAAIEGFGEVLLGSAVLSAAGGNILASGGRLVLDADLEMSNGGSAAIAGGASLDLIEGASGSVVFEGVNAELIINDLAVASAAISGMVGHDVIDLVGIAPSLVTYSGGVITGKDGSDNVIGSFALSIANGQPAVAIVSDGSGGALITLADEMACFARGTRLLTPNGYKPVEAFSPGDPIITQYGAKKPVRWIGQQVVQTGLHGDMRPVVVRPGALGPGLPSREIRLSPSHALFMDGVLVPVMHLVNGATIIRERKPGAVTYYHIELDRHAVVMADGLAVETYLDTGNRGQFQQETGLRGAAATACAPMITNGPKLAQLRRQLHETAIRTGFTTIREPALHAIVRDLKCLPSLVAQNGVTAARFTLPPDAGRIMLIAQSAAPADTDPDSDDRRALGICLRQPKAKRDRLQLGAGWYDRSAGDAGIWMGGSGEVFVPPGATELTLQLAAVAQSWRAPQAIDFQSPGF